MFDRTDQRYLEFRELTEIAFASLIEDSLRQGRSLDIALDEAASLVQTASFHRFGWDDATALPPFEEDGVLPATHRCSLAEFKSRFGIGAQQRQRLVVGVVRLYSLAQKAAAQRLLIGGSFIDDVRNPKDVDAVVLIERDSLRTHHGQKLFALFQANSLAKEGVDFKLEASEAGWWGWYRLLGKLREPSPGYRGLVEIRL